MTNRRAELNVVIARVAQARSQVESERERIAKLKALGCSTLGHDMKLSGYLRSLRNLEEYEKHLKVALGVAGVGTEHS